MATKFEFVMFCVFIFMAAAFYWLGVKKDEPIYWVVGSLWYFKGVLMFQPK